MRNAKKVSLAILALSAVSLGGIAFGNVAVLETSATNSLTALDTFRVENVSVRLAVDETETNGGIRFETLVSEATYNTFENVTEVGTLFVPAGFNVADTSIALDENGNALHAKVQKVVLQGGAENRNGALKTTDENEVAVISYRAYINNIPETAFYTDIVARSYVMADGVTYYTDTVVNSVGEVATSAYYDVQNEADEVYANEVADGWYSPFNSVQREEIAEYVKTTSKTYADKYVVVANGNATLDLTKLSVSASDVVNVLVDGKFVEWSVDGSTLTYATTVGEKTLTVATTKGVYNVALVQADNVITTGDQFHSWTESWGAAKYTVLANDITAKSGTHWINGKVFPAGNVFNGLGHTIDKFNSGKGIVHGLGGGSIWKNVNYTNYSGDTVLYAFTGGTFENVNVTGIDTNQFSLLAYTINSNSTVIKNCTFNINHQTLGTSLNVATKGSQCNVLTLIDTTVIYGNGQLTTNDLDLSKCSNYNLYDIDDVKTNYYAKVSGGTATFALSQMGEDAPATVSKLLVNGVEVQPTVENGVLSYPASGVGATALIMTTEKGLMVKNIVHADNVLTTWDEFRAWGTDATKINTYKYTVLANNITDTSTDKTKMAQFNNAKDFEKTFDGLGHTIDGFKAFFGITNQMYVGATWKNVNYTNMQISDYGILANYFQGGRFENIHVTGVEVVKNDPNSGILGYQTGAHGTVIDNCTFTITDAVTKNITKALIGGSVHNYTFTVSNTTVTYCNEINHTTCICKGTYGCSGKPVKTTYTNTTINGVKVG